MSPEEQQRAALRQVQEELARLRLEEERLRVENEQLLDTQRVLEDARDRFIDLYNSAPAAWITLDPNGVLQNLNLSAVELLQTGRRHLVSAPLSTLLVPEDRPKLLEHLRTCPEGSEPAICALRFTRAGGPLPLRLSTRRAHGAFEGYTSTLVDLSDRRAFAAEHERLTNSERELRAENQAKNQFIAMLSHELRTPLTPLLAVASAFADSQEITPELRAAFVIVQRNIRMETQLIDDLLDPARIAHGKLRVERQAMDLHGAIGDAIETLAAEIADKRLQVKSDLAAPHSSVSGDPARLRQVFWNLLRNAIKFTAPGGEVIFRTWNRDHLLLVEISDDGRGIANEELERLFEPFQQAPDDSRASLRGLGLGLPICRGILEQHGARIFAHSAGPGKGARFVIEIGWIDSLCEVRSPPSVAPPAMPSKPRLLLVEDHEDTAEILTLLLKRDGFEVQVADSVQAALAVAQGSFDVLVSDLGLGDGTGHDLMRSLRERGAVNGIALSGYGTEDDVRNSKEAGFLAHVTKPVDYADLLAAISKAHRPPAG